jgi:hypothetical protein
LPFPFVFFQEKKNAKIITKLGKGEIITSHLLVVIFLKKKKKKKKRKRKRSHYQNIVGLEQTSRLKKWGGRLKLKVIESLKSIGAALKFI